MSAISSPEVAEPFRLRALLTTGRRRTVRGWVRLPILALAVFTALWSVYQALISDMDVLGLTIIFLTQVLTLTFLTVSPTAGARRDRIFWLDYVCAALAIAAGVHFALQIDVIESRITLFDPLSTGDLFFSSAILVLLLEASRRTIGFDMAVLIVLFVLYNLFGNWIGGLIGHQGVSYAHFVDVAFFTTDGVFGVPLRVAATYAFLFVIFGNLLTRCGGGEFLYKLSAALAGRNAGGPAKVAVISSGLFGSVSGNPVADVVTTGSVTIPMMVRSGFQPKIAAAIEATASNGGALMPPVMGAAAFIMAEFTGFDYGAIALAALVPALLYYVSLYAQVHFYARAQGLRGLPRNELPRFWQTLRADAPMLLPLVALVGTLAAGYSPSMVAFVAAVSVILAASLRRSTRLGLLAILEQLAEATERMMPVAIACAAAGLILAGMTMTGLANKFSEVIVFISGDSLVAALMCAAVLTTLLGLGLPTSSTYILAAILIGGILEKLGVGKMQAHLFLLYFAAMSALTPPVAISSYAAAAIAGTNPFTTSMYAMRKAAVAFLVPFGFVANQGLILAGPWWGIALAITAATLGVILLASAFEGFLETRLKGWERTLLAAGGLALLAAPLPLGLLGLLPALAGASRTLRASLGRRTVPAE
ncbi:TRAP transporter fused permease subunit [Aquabacter sp. CN5-332]|uniref:TRAP transporter permease n=1 Tax=Aquabacter sp. CN5-332 TaxID=3156608 RepID=UPI0032B4B769